MDASQNQESSPQDLLNLLFDLQHQAEAQQQPAPGGEIDQRLAMLRGWQTRRLAHTYADLLETAQYRPACLFFLEDIYAPRDFSQRDQDAEHLYRLLARYLPETMLQLLADAIRINQLTNRLDQQLLNALFVELKVGEQITPRDYATAYRLCDNYAEREEQIELLVRILDEAAHGARRPVFAISLRLARLPAYHAGWIDLYNFLERGYQSCKPMKDVGYFVETIRQRELRILKSIFDAEADPFDGFLV